MKPTPKTDAKAEWILSELGPHNNGRFAAMADFARTLEEQNELLREMYHKEQSKTIAAVNMLCVLNPIDWHFVFSAPMNGQHNAQRIIDAMERLRKTLNAETTHTQEKGR